jgi:hypothetical protein
MSDARNKRVLYFIVCAAPPAQQTDDFVPLRQTQWWNVYNCDATGDSLAQIHGTSRINPNHRRSLLSINPATIVLEREAIEEACQLATDALNMLSQSKSSLVLQHLVRFRRKLEPWKSQATVETFNTAFLRIQASFLKRNTTIL